MTVRKYKIVYNSEEFIYNFFYQFCEKLKSLIPNVSLPNKEDCLFTDNIINYIKRNFDIEISTYEEEEVEPVKTLEEVKAEKTSEIQQKSDNLISQVKAGYTQGEIATFEQQYQGATDILNGNSTSTNATFVLGLLNGRLGHTASSEEITTFCELVRNNYFTAASATGTILGKQQNLEIQVRNATTIEEVKAIIWED